MTEAIQLALFPQDRESREAQYAARALWQVMQDVDIPGEESPRGLLQRSNSRAEKTLYGRFPRFGMSAIGLKRRISKWFAKAMMSDRGHDVLHAVELEAYSSEDAKATGDVVAEAFMHRLEVSRDADKNLERVRQWLREEIRKNDATALTVKRRVESEVTRVVEVSSALAGFGAVQVSVDEIGMHGLNSLLASSVAAIFVFFGTKVALRHRPLLPRQVGFRLFVLEVICRFLEAVMGVRIVRTVPSAQAAIQSLAAFVALDTSTSPRARGSSLPQARGSPLRKEKPGAIGSHLAISGARKPLTASVNPTGHTAEDSRRIQCAMEELHENIVRLNDAAANVNDPFVHGALLKLEGLSEKAQSVDDLLFGLIQALDQLSR